jgi:uncharacterized coiled-coil protein SlyX
VKNNELEERLAQQSQTITSLRIDITKVRERLRESKAQQNDTKKKLRDCSTVMGHFEKAKIEQVRNLFYLSFVVQLESSNRSLRARLEIAQNELEEQKRTTKTLSSSIEGYLNAAALCDSES